jgi:hypothetical protein
MSLQNEANFAFRLYFQGLNLGMTLPSETAKICKKPEEIPQNDEKH